MEKVTRMGVDASSWDSRSEVGPPCKKETVLTWQDQPCSLALCFQSNFLDRGRTSPALVEVFRFKPGAAPTARGAPGVISIFDKGKKRSPKKSVHGT